MPSSSLNMSVRLAASLLAALLCGCAGQMAYREAESLAAQDQTEAAMVKYREAVGADPANARYRVSYLNARDKNSTRLIEQAERNLADGKATLARQDYQRALGIDPGNERARVGLRAIEADARQAMCLKLDASLCFCSGDCT